MSHSQLFEYNNKAMKEGNRNSQLPNSLENFIAKKMNTKGGNDFAFAEMTNPLKSHKDIKTGQKALPLSLQKLTLNKNLDNKQLHGSFPAGLDQGVRERTMDITKKQGSGDDHSGVRQESDTSRRRNRSRSRDTNERRNRSRSRSGDRRNQARRSGSPNAASSSASASGLPISKCYDSLGKF